MIDGFAELRIAVPNLGTAITDYETLLGISGRHDDGAAKWPLANIALSLEAASVSSPEVSALTLWSQQTVALPANTLGLSLDVRSTRETADHPAEDIYAVDHIVLRTASADACIALFGEALGMRLALDQAVPEWGGRMLFFRCGKLTLEVIQSLEEPVERDHFWGVTYLCGDLNATLARLDDSGVQHSGAREGRKPGTRVATVKSHHLGIPTLLIEPASKA